MDVPVAIAIGGAYLASTFATVRGSGTVYFDSVCMFTFFLLVGRFLEQQARQRADARIGRLLKRAPRTARRLTADGEEMVPARALHVGDHVRVLAGETIPADGVVERGESAVDEALLTGEPRPRARRPGDAVVGGGLNVESPIELRVQRAGAETVLAQIVALMDRAQSERPEIARSADRVARVFVGVLLVLGVVCFAFWSQRAPELAFPITLALLVASCPCALALATPAALTAAHGALAGVGLLVVRGHVIEGLARLTDAVFDKTGTLTRGMPEGVMIRLVGGRSEMDALARARVLEQHSEHPLAAGFGRWPTGEPELLAQTVRRLEWVTRERRVVGGCGVEAEIDGVRHRLGRAEWALEGLDHVAQMPEEGSEVDQLVLLANELGPVAWFGLRDELRSEARGLVEMLEGEGIEVTLLSGDPSSAAPRLADRLGISRALHGVSPAEKRGFVQSLQAEGRIVAMVGDGINDAPVLAQAQVSIAMGGGSDLARIHADAVLLEDDLAQIGRAIRFARRTRRIIRQNLVWALVYNATVVPLAAAGMVAPWAAAIGMSSSSLIVVGNALRLRRMEDER
jgi:Cu2+-exporting ATPase